MQTFLTQLFSVTGFLMNCERCITRRYITKNSTLFNKVNSAGIFFYRQRLEQWGPRVRHQTRSNGWKKTIMNWYNPAIRPRFCGNRGIKWRSSLWIAVVNLLTYLIKKELTTHASIEYPNRIFCEKDDGNTSSDVVSEEQMRISSLLSKLWAFSSM